MSFVANAQQIAAFKKRCASPSYSQEAVVVEFTTTRAFVESVLPPSLAPADQPTGLISISLWQSNVCGFFELSSVSVRCRHKNGIEGYWVLHLLVSEVPAITWGRETWGEVKKEGKIRLMSNGRRKHGFAERAGVRLIEMEAEFLEDLSPDANTWVDFEAKVFPNARGDGLEMDPQLITLDVMDDSPRRARGKGKLKLRGTASDPLHTIPVLEVADYFEYCSGTSTWTVRSVERMCSAEEYMPFLVLRHYDSLVGLPVGVGLPAIEVSTDKGEEEEEEEEEAKAPGC